MTQRNISLVLVIVAVAVFAFRIPIGKRARIVPHQPAAATHTLLGAAQPEQPAKKNSPAPLIEATAALVIDPATMRPLFEKNADMPLPIASISKIMTALVALERAHEYDIVTVSANAIATESAAGNLLAGERIRMRDLIAMMMVESSNDAAVAIAEHVGTMHGATAFDESQNLFTGLMNTQALDIGMRHTLFRNPTGLDLDKTTASNTSTAHDVALLLTQSMPYAAIWAPSEAATYTVASFDGHEHILTAINTFALTGHSVIGSKTGFTDVAGGTLAAIVEAPISSPKIIVILGSTREGRFADMDMLVAWTRE